jgi:hypothetical protein
MARTIFEGVRSQNKSSLTYGNFGINFDEQALVFLLTPDS